MSDFKNEINSILNIISNDLIEVNNRLPVSLNSKSPLVSEISNYIINSGGKRVRCVIALLLAKALNYDNDFKFDAAVIIEYIHVASLLHDDVVDNSEFRRGKKVANIVYGNPASILSGDYIYTRALQILATFNSMDIMKETIDAINTIAEGEVDQLSLLKSELEITEDEYFQVIYKKTAKLFEASSVLISMLSSMESDLNISKEIKEKTALYGKYFGILFQIIDDLIDYLPNKVLDKKRGDDLAEGKITLPLIHLLQNANSKDKIKLYKILKSDNRIDYLDEVYALMQQYGSIDYSYEKAIYYKNKAKDSINLLEDSEAKEGLLRLVDISFARDF
ncbi:MAG: polyprenyl synthetase family protein [Psittacicella sp.]